MYRLLPLGLVCAIVLGLAAAEDEPITLVYDPGKDKVFSLRIGSAEVMTASAPCWGPDYTWLGTKVRWEGAPGADGARRFAWSVAGAGIDGGGTVVPGGDGRTQSWRWDLTAARDIPAAGSKAQMHGGLSFSLQLKADVRAGAATEPVIAADGLSFTWEIRPQVQVAVAFRELPAKLYFEKGSKGEIRAMLLQAPQAAGSISRSMTLTLPAGTRTTASDREIFEPEDTSGWCANVLDMDKAIIDLSHLNEKPAGRRGFVKPVGEEFRAADGTPMRFWATSICASSIFPSGASKDRSVVDKALIDTHARRLAAFGVNLVRLHQQDTFWCNPNLIAVVEDGTGTLYEPLLDGYFYTIKALQEQGIYVWIDLMTYHRFRAGDRIPGFADALAMEKKPMKGGGATMDGWNFFSPRVEELWQQLARDLLTRVNPYTGKTLPQDPAIIGYTIWNENTLPFPFGNYFIQPKAGAMGEAFKAAAKEFAQASGLPFKGLLTTWEPGVSMLFLNDAQHRWMARQRTFIEALGVQVAVCTGHLWGRGTQLHCLPALQSGDVNDVHDYFPARFLTADPRISAHPGAAMAMAQVAGRPTMITEFNLDASHRDEFTALPYTAVLAAFQGWDAPFFYAYAQDGYDGSVTRGNYKLSLWATYGYPTILGTSPMAALLYRQGHVRQAAKTVALKLDRTTTFLQPGQPGNRPALRTLPERHRQVIALGAVPELPWLKDSPIPAGAEVSTDLERDWSGGGSEIVADTGEFRRDWAKGRFIVDTPKSQFVMGGVGGGTFTLADATISVGSPQALVALTTLEDRPLSASGRILVTALGRLASAKAPAAGRKARNPDILSEPVAATIDLRTTLPVLELVPLAGDGRELPARPLARAGDRVRVVLPTDAGTHWFLLRGVRQ